MDIDYLKSEGVKEFIKNNIKSDIQKIILNPPKEFKQNIKLIADQILARQKAKGKLNEWALNYDLILPPPLSIEQASSQLTAAYKNELISGEYLIDLTGGMGIDCIHLSQNFSSVSYVEQQPNLVDIFNHNCNALGLAIDVINSTAEDFLKDFKPTTKTVAFLDPARRDSDKSKVFRLEACSPDIRKVIPILEKKASQILIKLSPLIDIKSILREIHHIKEIYVVSVKNDCKEVLVLVDFAFNNEPLINTVNLGGTREYFQFTYAEEEASEAVFGKIGNYILEPNSSIMKAGAFKEVGNRFNLKKLGINTHLYSSDQIIKDWPGRIFEILDYNINKESIKTYAPNGHINVITRNHPMKAEQLKKKLKVIDGGDLYLIGFRGLSNKVHQIIMKRVH